MEDTNNDQVLTLEVPSSFAYEYTDQGVYSNDNDLNPGVFIDIDGVVLQGGKPFEFSVEAIHALWNHKIPFVFVTNGTYCSAVLVNNLRKIFDLPFTTDHVVVAPSPCSELYEFHNKRVLVCCQDDSLGLIPELGFTNYLTVEDMSKIFPELDYVDHKRRKVLLETPMSMELKKAQEEFRPIEAILLLGEPVNWECSLQLLLDVLMTNGDPRQKFKFVPNPHLPIIACNKDLTFKGAAALPRFGHGAFLECLESLYKKVTKNELVYEEMMGKPYLITYEYAANQIQKLSPNGRPINKFYIIGDNPDVDVKGANLFKEHLDNCRVSNLSASQKSSCKSSRRQSLSAVLDMDACRASSPVESILVCTGVYNPQNDFLFHIRKLLHPDSPTNADSLLRSDNKTMSNSTMILNATAMDVSSGGESSDAKVGQMRKNKSFNCLMQREELNPVELSTALSRTNSFISYFDDRLNVPDHTFDNLKYSVNYILKANGLILEN